MAAAAIDSSQSLENDLQRHGPLPARQSIDLLMQLAEMILARHRSGQLHLYIAPELVLYDRELGSATLIAPDHQDRLFGGFESDQDFCPPELQHRPALRLHQNLAAAQTTLQTSGMTEIDARRIDCYQLGVLFCRALTGQSVGAFLSSPKAVARIPLQLRGFLEQILGHDAEHAIRNSQDLLNGLAAVRARSHHLAPAQRLETRADGAGVPDSAAAGHLQRDGTDARVDDDGALPFQTIEHYEIVSRLGRGGMGDVYKAYDARLNRHVAIKVLSPEFSRHPDLVSRFYAEATAAAKLVHPNTIEIFYVSPRQSGDSVPPLHFFAMRYIDGESLAQLLARRRKLSVDESLEIIGQVLSGLQAAHRLGMVHRDIKPGNILLDRDHHKAFLADFGLVKSLSGMNLTASGVIVGTVDYMSPEQGNAKPVDARSDLYSIGIVMFQMLSGRPPFTASSPSATIYQHVHEPPPDLKSVAGDVPEAVCQIVNKLLAKSADGRYQSTDALLADVRAAQRHELLTTGRLVSRPGFGNPGATEPDVGETGSGANSRAGSQSAIVAAPVFPDEAALPTDRTLSRHRLRNVWQRMKGLVLLPSARQMVDLRHTETEVDRAIAEFERRRDSLQQSIDEARLTISRLERERDVWSGAVANAAQRASRSDRDDERFLARAEQDRGERMLSELSDQSQAQQAELASMHRRLLPVAATLASLRGQQAVLIARLKVAGARIQLAGGNDVQPVQGTLIRRARWGNIALSLCTLAAFLIAIIVLRQAALPFAMNRGLTPRETVTLNIESHARRGTAANALFFGPPNIFAQPLDGFDANVVKLAVGRGDKLIAAATGGSQVHIWDVDARRPMGAIGGNLRPVNTVALNSDESILATGESSSANGSTVKLWNPYDGQLLWSIPETEGYVSQLAFQPAGPLLAAAFFSAQAVKPRIWDYQTREVYWEVPVAKSTISNLTFSSNGAFVAGFAAQYEVFVGDLKQRTVRTWIAPSACAFTFLGDSSHMAIAGRDGTISVWDAATGTLVSSRQSGLVDASSIASSRDGQKLAVSNGKSIVITDAQSGLALSVLPGHQTTALAFSRLGDWLVTAGGAPFVARWPVKSPPIAALGPTETVSPGRIIAVSPFKPLAVLQCGPDVAVWNYQQRLPAVVLKLRGPQNARHLAAAFSSDCHRVAVLNASGTLSVTSLPANAPIDQIHIPVNDEPPGSAHLAFADNGNVIWISCLTGLWKAHVTASKAEPWLEWPLGHRTQALSPEGRFAVTIDADGRLYVWDVASKQSVINEAGAIPFDSFTFTKDGHSLTALRNDGTLFRWNLMKRELVDRFAALSNGLRDSRGVAYAGNSNTLVALTSQGHLQLLDVQRRTPVGSFGPHVDQRDPQRSDLRSAANIWISYDGHFAMTNSADGEQIQLWDLWIQRLL